MSVPKKSKVVEVSEPDDEDAIECLQDGMNEVSDISEDMQSIIDEDMASAQSCENKEDFLTNCDEAITRMREALRRLENVREEVRSG